jgi:hypothetical protein
VGTGTMDILFVRCVNPLAGLATKQMFYLQCFIALYMLTFIFGFIEEIPKDNTTEK